MESAFLELKELLTKNKTKQKKQECSASNKSLQIKLNQIFHAGKTPNSQGSKFKIIQEG